MSYPKAQDIINDVIIEAGMVSGSGVQTYAEPQVMIAIQRMFSFLWNKQPWPHLWDWQVATLDGTTGKFTTALTGVRQWEDIGAIRLFNTSQAVVRSHNTDHLYVNGSQAMYWTPLAWDDANADDKFVKLWPITSTSQVEIFCGHRPARFTPSDTVPFDRDIITLGSLWYTLASDGLNAGAAEATQGLFDIAFSDYQARIAPSEIGHGVHYTGVDTFRL